MLSSYLKIAFRKVLGSSVREILLLLVRDFTKWILAAKLIAIPIACYAMSRWLQDFANRIHIGWWIFALAGALTLLLAWLTVSLQVFRTARANPVEALRYE